MRLNGKKQLLQININFLHVMQVPSNLCSTTTLGTPKKWSLLTGGLCSEVVVSSGLAVHKCMAYLTLSQSYTNF
jgi:hypothetical protein